MKRSAIIWSVSIILISMLGCGRAEQKKETEATPVPEGEKPMQEEPVQEEPVQESEIPDLSAEERDAMIAPDPIIFEYEEEYTISKWGEADTGIQAPGGICRIEDRILVCDMKGHCITELDRNGSAVCSYGQLGAGEGEFQTPTAICYAGEQIYVLDAGNNRVQIFDKQMQFVREEPFSGITFMVEGKGFIDLAVDGEGTIFLSNNDVAAGTAHVYYLEAGALHGIPGRLSGHLSSYDGQVYALDTFMLYTSGSGKMGATAGNNYFYRCTKEGLERISEFPYMYAPTDFVILNDVVYTVSMTWEQMNRASFDGELLSAITTFYDSGTVHACDWYLEVEDDDSMYAVSVGNKCIYRLVRE